jgi:putative restriction endonuclease
VLIGLIGQEASILSERKVESVLQKPMQVENSDVEMWEHHIESKIESDTRIPDTEREALIVARRGQGLFKQRVMEIETRCRITGVTNPIHLRASHCKPWRDCNNEERLNGKNGLLLTPTIDHLFDRGFISFEDSGVLIVSPVAHSQSLNRMGVATDRIVNVGTFTEGQKEFLEYHRESVLSQVRH